MALNIIVCVKHTPSSANVSVDGSGKPKLDGVAFAINPFDEFAVEAAVRLKEQNPGSTATALTLGPTAAESVLREAISRGCTTGVIVSGPEVENGDSYSTSFALAAAIKKLAAEKPVHLVLFGKNSNDDNSGVTGAQVAAWLDWPGASSIKKIEAIDETSATVIRTVEDGAETLKLTLPAALGTVKEINEPRLPSLKGKMAAKKAALTKWTVADIAVEAAQIGAAGAQTQTLKSTPPPARPAGMKVEGASAQEKASKLVDILLERKLI